MLRTKTISRITNWVLESVLSSKRLPIFNEDLTCE